MAEIAEDYKRLSGPQKAAVFLLALEEEQSAKLFEMMEDDEIKEISQVMSNVGTVTAAMVEHLFMEFADQLSGTGSLAGNYSTTERLLISSLGKDKADQIMEELRGPAGRTMWDKLGNVNETVLANYFKNEYPQTVAVVLSRLNSDHAARVLALFPENFGMEVITRMLHMETVQKDVLDDVERTLRTEFMTNLARAAPRDSHESMAEIFNNFDRSTEERFFAGLGERNPESAEKIKALMFTFDDLVRADAAGIQMLLRQVEKDQLAVALKGASDEVKALFFQNMSDRAGKMMKEDMEAMGAVRLRDVDEAQAAVVASAKTLSDAGEIIITGGGADEELIY
jgi:flagellar motor switch protein FliG